MSSAGYGDKTPVDLQPERGPSRSQCCNDQRRSGFCGRLKSWPLFPGFLLGLSSEPRIYESREAQRHTIRIQYRPSSTSFECRLTAVLLSEIIKDNPAEHWPVLDLRFQEALPSVAKLDPFYSLPALA